MKDKIIRLLETIDDEQFLHYLYILIKKMAQR